MITDEQVRNHIQALPFRRGQTISIPDVLAALEAYEQSKWVKFDSDDESTYPQKSGHHIAYDGRAVSHKYWDNTGDDKRFRNQSWFVSDSVNFKKVTRWQYLPVPTNI